MQAFCIVALAIAQFAASTASANVTATGWVPCTGAGGACCNPYAAIKEICPGGEPCQECGGGSTCQCGGSSPSLTPFAALGCQYAIPIGGNSIWQRSGGRWPSCDQDVSSDGMKKCISSNGQVDETSIMFDMSAKSSKTGCFVSEALGCGTDMTLVSKIEFDLDFSECHDVWAAPLWITPQTWIKPGGTSGEIDFLEMCPVGTVATNFGASGQPGETQRIWGEGIGADGPKHFILTLDQGGNLKTRICHLDGSGCFDGAHYDGFLNRITSKRDHHFVSDIWNGYSGDGGWYGCGARHSPNTNCRYAVMNIRVHTRNGIPLYSGNCAALNGQGSALISDDVANSTVIV